MKNEFLNNLSHELRTPLNAIHGWAKAIAQRKCDDTVIYKGVEIIERKAKDLTKIVYDLLDMSRMVKGLLCLDAGWVELDRVIREAIASLQLAAEAKSIKIEMQLDSECTNPLRGDANRLRQVIWHLLCNSIKFTPPGGQINVKLSKVEQFAQIEVSDTGLGISSSFIPYVFDHFCQGDGSISRLHGGLGLGLSLVEYLIEMHGGTIEVLSPGQGKGTTARVKLPLE